VLFAEVDHMRWFCLRFLKVPNLEVLSLVDSKEFTNTGRETSVLTSCGRFLLLFFAAIFGCGLSLIEIEQAPL